MSSTYRCVLVRDDVADEVERLAHDLEREREQNTDADTAD